MKHFDDKTLKEFVILGHTGLKMAWEGDLDEVWKNAPPIDGRSQRDIFFENVSKWLPKMEAEALARGLHRTVKKSRKKR